MASMQDVPASADRRRSHHGAVLHGVAVVIFGLMVWSGVDGLGVGAQALGVPMVITGAAGATGALVIVWSMLRRPGLNADPRPPARMSAQRAARIGMALAAVAAVAVGVVLAPIGWEREFVIAVNGVTGGLLAVFAPLAGGRAARAQGEDRPQR
ncbi:hypothetical protein WEI85_24200 [Actinomycetes bacterium KLBMP 9797]